MIAVFRASVHGIARRDYTAAQVGAWAPETIDRVAWAQRFDRHRVWVAEDTAGTLGGFIQLADDGCVDMLYVHPAFAGQGVATALLAQAEAAARRLGNKCLLTAASITARPFFERRGFRMIAPQTVQLRGLLFRNFRMAKDVDPRDKMAGPLQAEAAWQTRACDSPTAKLCGRATWQRIRHSTTLRASLDRRERRGSTGTSRRPGSRWRRSVYPCRSKCARDCCPWNGSPSPPGRRPPNQNTTRSDSVERQQAGPQRGGTLD